MTKRALLLTAIVLLAAVAPATAAATGQSGSVYAGSHVTFDTKSDAIVDYSVDGTTAMQSVQVQSQSSTESGLGLGASAGLSAITNVAGAALSVQTSASASATVQAESGATLRAHDNGHGSLVVSADENAQYVEVALEDDASVEQETEERLVVTSGGTTQAYAVAGEGNVTLGEDGTVTAAVEQGSRLVIRTYADGRSSQDEQREELIANGTAAASVYLMQEDGEAVTDTVKYGQETTVTVSERSANRVNMTVSRTASEGKVVLVSTSDAAFEATNDVQVSVDGEAAARASSYAELRQATEGGSTSKYVVTGSGSAQASGNVAVAINHFSDKSVTMTSDQTDGSDGDGGSTTSGSGPGFGVLAALAALAGIAGIRRSSGN